MKLSLSWCDYVQSEAAICCARCELAEDRRGVFFSDYAPASNSRERYNGAMNDYQTLARGIIVEGLSFIHSNDDDDVGMIMNHDADGSLGSTSRCYIRVVVTHRVPTVFSSLFHNF